MSVSTVVTALQSRHTALSGVTLAPATLPASISPAMLPLVITIPGEATWARARIGGYAVQARVYIVRVYAAAVNSGAGLDEGFAKATALLETFGDSYAASHAAGTGYQIEPPYTDSGHLILVWGENQYHGFEFRLPVKKVTT